MRAGGHHFRVASDPNETASAAAILRRLGSDVEWVRDVDAAHRPPSSAAESVGFEQRILAWYDTYLKAERKPGA
jgi:hypothetical protein